MIETLLIHAVLAAPEIGSALAQYLAREFAKAMVEEVTNGFKFDVSDIVGSIASFSPNSLSDSFRKLEELPPGLQARLFDIMERALKEFNLVLIGADELAELRRLAGAKV